METKRESLNIAMSAVCGRCHGLENEPTKIVDPKVPDRWLVQSFFRHDTHRAIECLSCHAQASQDAPPPSYSGKLAKSLKWTGRTRQIMMPGIELCQTCHNPQANVRSDCVTCHFYHNPSPWLGQGGAFVKSNDAKAMTITDFLASDED